MKKLFSFLMMIFLTTPAAYAKSVNLLSEPQANSQIAETLNTDEGVAVIYTPAHSEWIKVGDPKNGKVGWVKSKELGGEGYKLEVHSSKNGANFYSYRKWMQGSNADNEKLMMRQMHQLEQEQRMMQMHMVQLFNHMFSVPENMFMPVEEPNQHKPLSTQHVHKDSQASVG